MNGLEAKRKVWRDLNDSLHGDIYKSDTGYTSMSSSVNGKQLEKAVHGNEFSAFSSSVHFDECNDLSSLSSMEAKAADLFSTSSMLFVNQVRLQNVVKFKMLLNNLLEPIKTIMRNF